MTGPITDDAVMAYIRAYQDRYQGRSGQPAGQHREAVRAGLAAALPHLAPLVAARALREAAIACRAQGDRYGGSLALSYASDWMRRRADEMERGTRGDDDG